MPTPRVFIVRHGETEWSVSGAHTGKTDIPLTANGERRVRTTARALVGPDRLIQPANLAAVLVSPRQRARRTLGLLLEESDAAAQAEAAGVPSTNISEQDVGSAVVGAHAPVNAALPAVQGAEGQRALQALKQRGCVVEVREDASEWDYGQYEGLKTSEITAQRAAEGKAKWHIWSEGAPGGESPAEITARLDGLIHEIKTRFHGPAFQHLGEHGRTREEHCPPGDVILIAHGHILRCFAARWVGKPVTENPHFILEAGGVGTLSYEHDRVEEPALVLGGAFVG